MKFVGRYIVTEPSICHGKPTFRGTRIFVEDVFLWNGLGEHYYLIFMCR
jgi:uncharacterized protein (DUF433 family)